MVVHKVSSCFNSMCFSLWWRWESVGLVGKAVWARPSEVRTDASHSKGSSLTPLLPAAGSHLTWGLSMSAGRRWCGYISHIVTTADGEMPLPVSLWFSWLFHVSRESTLTHNCMLMSFSSCPTQKNKIWRQIFSHIPFFQSTFFLRHLPYTPEHKFLGISLFFWPQKCEWGMLDGVEMEQMYHKWTDKMHFHLTCNRSPESVERVWASSPAALGIDTKAPQLCVPWPCCSLINVLNRVKQSGPWSQRFGLFPGGADSSEKWF